MGHRVGSQGKEKQEFRAQAPLPPPLQGLEFELEVTRNLLARIKDFEAKGKDDVNKLNAIADSKNPTQMPELKTEAQRALTALTKSRTAAEDLVKHIETRVQQAKQNNEAEEDALDGSIDAHLIKLRIQRRVAYASTKIIKKKLVTASNF